MKIALAGGAPLRRLLPVGVAAVLLLVPSLCFAGFATSGIQYRETNNISGSGLTRSCLEATINTTSTSATNSGVNYAYDNVGNNCDGARTLPSGWLGVTIDGYRSGSFCGTTNYHYSNGATSAVGLAAGLCANPAGTQDFHTNVFGRIYSGSFYYDISGIAGPSQNG